jgi:hypothetical protein
LALVALLAPPRWRFEATAAKLAGVTAHEQVKRVHHFSYRDIRDVKVLVTPSQERRGVGTLVISRSSVLDEPAILRNVPEPERLAEWLRSQRDSARDPGK